MEAPQCTFQPIEAVMAEKVIGPAPTPTAHAASADRSAGYRGQELSPLAKECSAQRHTKRRARSSRSPSDGGDGPLFVTQLTLQHANKHMVLPAATQVQQVEFWAMQSIKDDRLSLMMRALTRKNERDHRRCSPSPLSSHASSRCNSPAPNL